MRLLLAVLLLLVSVSAHAAAPAEQASGPDGPTKRALVIAVADYPDAGGYPDLNADNDVPLIVEALARHGFADDATTVLLDADATRAGILGALDALVEASQSGDVIVLHYSGHGVRLTDDDGDELDGYDEALAPYDAVTAPLDAAITSHLRDDDLGVALDRLRRAVGPTGSVAVWIDACYSGTATRGTAPLRGRSEPIGPPADTDGDGVPDIVGVFEAPSTRSGPGEDDALAPIVVLSASGPNEPNREYKHFYTEDGRRRAKLYGSLSYALNQALQDVAPGETYRAFFDRIAARMGTLAGDQTPQAEGTLDALLFSGETVTQAPFYRVAEVADTAEVTLDGGTLNGLLADARVAFFPRGTTAPDAPGATLLATGSVATSTPTTAAVTLDSTATGDLTDAWVFVTAPGFGPMRLYVELDPSLDATTREDLALVVGDTPALELAADETGGEVRLARDGNDFVLTATRDGSVLGDPIPATGAAGPGTSAAALSAVRQRLVEFARNAYLKQVELSHDGIDVTLELVPGRFYQDSQGTWRMDTTAVVAKQGSGLWQFAPNPLGDDGELILDPDGTSGFVFRLRNRGAVDAHVALLELYPDGTIAQIAPTRDGGEYLLAAGQSKLLSLEESIRHARIPRTPLGAYVFKLFATEAPIDFAPILSSRPGERSGSTRGDGPLDALMEGVHSGTRSGGLAPPPQTGATATLVMEVVEAQ